ncbi:calcium-activated potassium channel subunit beta-2-like [Brienomyrus brachyistius]|uniref:calcium-activated potassium channel subunit beta-2-like n=1 Tax=Brienomyrus brachyistius TaxID=42636 RepID=UPI0020B27E49|nr:calcium-activated potassium channel subunit beta-2-like [Brienomyrus brachyistius]
MFLWAGSKGAQGPDQVRRTIYHKIWEYDTLDKKKTVTALKAGEDRAIFLGLVMILCSIVIYFILGITIVRSYSDSVWTEESSCCVINSTIIGEINCTYSCGSDCRKTSKYPCLQVFVSLNASGKTVRLLLNEEMHIMNPDCFYVPKCQKDLVTMHTVIINIIGHLRLHPQFRCYHDPAEHQDSVLLTQLYSRTAVLQSLFWPTIIFFGGTIIIALVKLTQYLSILCEKINKIKG